jgi:hypothetical protein
LIRRLALGVLFVVSGAIGAAGQNVIQLRDPGPRGGPPALTQALSGPYVVVPPAADRALIARDAEHPRTVIVLGRDAVVEGSVRGDVIVIGGDLYMHPGADISGRAVAIGGGVYESTQARIGGGIRPYREFTYDIAHVTGGWELTYRQIEVADDHQGLPSLYGLRVPTYDRSNGLSLPIAPTIAVPRTRPSVEPRLTYRSQLGRLDPSIVVLDSIGANSAVRVSAGRSAFSNDAWIWSDLVNSLEVLWRGDDSRNYFRATRGEVTLERNLQPSSGVTLAPYVGGRIEKASSVRPDSFASGGPWSFFGRHDVDDMLRPNPTIDPGSIGSLLAGAQLTWTPSDITARLRIDEELGAFSEDCGGCDLIRGGNFAQTTLDGTIAFPTFGMQSLRFDGHAVITSHGTTPRQRWAYVGGSGSIPTIEMLSHGGDQLLYVDARYDIPVDAIALPLGVIPVVTLREILGGANVGRFPTLAQASGVRLTASFLYVEWLIDPVARHPHFSFGISIAR